ncbi:YetF domain-containing protein, partial [Rothia mucilaginosa]
LRAQGIYDLEDIEFAQIEPNGVLSVIRKGDGVPNFALIVKGTLVTRDIADAHKTEDWVYLQLRAAEVELEDVFLMEFKNGNRLLILLNDGTTIRREVAEASNMNDKEEEWQEGVEEAPEPEDTEDAKKEVAEHAAEDAHPTKDSKA